MGDVANFEPRKAIAAPIFCYVVFCPNRYTEKCGEYIVSLGEHLQKVHPEFLKNK